MTCHNDYYIENKRDLIQKLKFQLEIYNIKYDISYENISNALSEYFTMFLNEEIDYYNEHNNIINTVHQI